MKATKTPPSPMKAMKATKTPPSPKGSQGSKGSKQGSKGSKQGSKGSKHVDLPLPLSKTANIWCFNTYNVAAGARVSRTPGNALRLDYAAGKVGSSSGLSAHASVPSLFPCDEICLSYNVFLPNSWDPVRGGKLPGLILGTGASGGNWSEDGGSARVVFKPKNKKEMDKNGVAFGYVYIPLQIGKRNDFKKLIPGYEKAFKATAKGEHVWAEGVSDLKLGEWNSVRMHIRLNTKNEGNGIFSLTINGVTRSIDTMRWRASDSLKIEGISLTSFYGGSGPSYAAPKDAFILLRDFALNSKP